MAKETKGGTWMDANGNDSKGHVNIYNKNPRGEHEESIHINIDYDKGTFTINEKSNGEKSSTDCKCFLTTACMRHKMEEFNDNCEELTLLRWFRDLFVTEEDIEHYYAVAPIIVKGINEREDSDIIFDYIYENVIKKCVNAIKNEQYKEAYNIYKNSVIALEEQYARPMLENRLVKVLR